MIRTKNRMHKRYCGGGKNKNLDLWRHAAFAVKTLIRAPISPAGANSCNDLDQFPPDYSLSGAIVTSKPAFIRFFHYRS